MIKLRLLQLLSWCTFSMRPCVSTPANGQMTSSATQKNLLNNLRSTRRKSGLSHCNRDASSCIKYDRLPEALWTESSTHVTLKKSSMASRQRTGTHRYMKTPVHRRTSTRRAARGTDTAAPLGRSRCGTADGWCWLAGSSHCCQTPSWLRTAIPCMPPATQSLRNTWKKHDWLILLKY